MESLFWYECRASYGKKYTDDFAYSRLKNLGKLKGLDCSMYHPAVWNEFLQIAHFFIVHIPTFKVSFITMQAVVKCKMAVVVQEQAYFSLWIDLGSSPLPHVLFVSRE